MSSDTDPPAANAWQRLAIRIRRYGATMDLTYDDIQDRRIVALEDEVARLRAIVDARAIEGTA